MKISPMTSKFDKVGSKECQTLNKLSKNCKKLDLVKVAKFSKSGHTARGITPRVIYPMPSCSN